MGDPLPPRRSHAVARHPPGRSRIVDGGDRSGVRAGRDRQVARHGSVGATRGLSRARAHRARAPERRPSSQRAAVALGRSHRCAGAAHAEAAASSRRHARRQAMTALTEPVLSIEHWALDPSIVHLNHGSFGGCPRVVTDAAAALRARLEAAPMRFLVLEWQRELDRARDALAGFLHAPAERLAFVPNATTGVATVLGSLRFAAGDEIITTSHAYRAIANQLARTGARVIALAIARPFDRERFIADVLAAVTPRTRLA